MLGPLSVARSRNPLCRAALVYCAVATAALPLPALLMAILVVPVVADCPG